MKKYNFVYKTTNLINKKIYVGVHSTDNLDDGYLGSGKRLLLAIRKYGKENFKREIISFVDSREDAYKLESEIVTTSFIENKDVYNITEGGYGVITHSEEGLKALSEYAKDKVVAKDKNGNFVKIDKDVFDNGDYTGTTKGIVQCIDKNGNVCSILMDEFEKSDEYYGVSKGHKTVRVKGTNDILYIKNSEFDPNIHEHILTGRVTVKDKDGNTFSVSKDDPRYLSGELVGVMKGRKYKINNKPKDIICPHCNKKGSPSNMKRWHFDNCKFKQ